MVDTVAMRLFASNSIVDCLRLFAKQLLLSAQRNRWWVSLKKLRHFLRSSCVDGTGHSSFAVLYPQPPLRHGTFRPPGEAREAMANSDGYIAGRTCKAQTLPGTLAHTHFEHRGSSVHRVSRVPHGRGAHGDATRCLDQLQKVRLCRQSLRDLRH